MPASLRLDVRDGAVVVYRDHLVVVAQREFLDRVTVRDLATGEPTTVPIGELRSRPVMSATERARQEEIVRASSQRAWNAATGRERIIRSLATETGAMRGRINAAATELNVSARTIERSSAGWGSFVIRRCTRTRGPPVRFTGSGSGQPGHGSGAVRLITRYETARSFRSRSGGTTSMPSAQRSIGSRNAIPQCHPPFGSLNR